jgi:hypothetical protein
MLEENAELKKVVFGSLAHASQMRLKPHRNFGS